MQTIVTIDNHLWIFLAIRGFHQEVDYAKEKLIPNSTSSTSERLTQTESPASTSSQNPSLQGQTSQLTLEFNIPERQNPQIRRAHTLPEGSLELGHWRGDEREREREIFYGWYDYCTNTIQINNIHWTSTIKWVSSYRVWCPFISLSGSSSSLGRAFLAELSWDIKISVTQTEPGRNW